MFRESVLVNEEVIKRVSETMVPIALNYQLVLDRSNSESKHIRSLIDRPGDIQGVYVFSPDGKQLGGSIGFGDMVGKTKRMLEASLKAFGPVKIRQAPARKLLPNRGIGFNADGGVTLAEYVRRSDRDKIKSPVISRLDLTAEEFKSFAPSKSAVRSEWNLPRATARKLCRLASPMCYQHAPQLGWVKSVTLKGRVQAVRNGVAELRYEGSLGTQRIMRDGSVLSKADLKMSGTGSYNLTTGKMQDLQIIGTGEFRWPREAPERKVPFHALLEWEAQLPPSSSKE